MKNKEWCAVLICTSVYAGLNTRSFIKGKLYTVMNGHLIDENGIPSFGRYSGVEELEGAFYAEFQTIMSFSSRLPITFPRQ